MVKKITYSTVTVKIPAPEDTKKMFEKVKTKANRESFPTYRQAIQEINRLQIENEELSFQNHSLSKRRPGRPEKMKLPSSESLLNRFGGRPQKTTKAEMIDIVKSWDERRRLFAKENSKKSVSDKEIIDHVINTDERTRSWLSNEKKIRAKELYEQLRYFRSKTGILQGHIFKSRTQKTSLK